MILSSKKKNSNSSSPKLSRKEESARHRSATLITEKSSFSIVEAYKAARTNIVFALGAHKGCKKIIVTSASPGEGKTTTTLNLAIVFAQMNAKVLVIDADLRKPRIYRHLQLERKNGLSDVLCGLISLDKVIHHCDNYGIDCITSGQIPPNPAELLSSDEMGNVLDQLSEMYDYIFLDTPPVTIVTEASAMAKFAHGVIIVARQAYTLHESLQRARETLLFANAKILGYVLNDIDTSHYGYGYNRYSYGKYGRGKYGYGGYGYGGYGYGYGSYGYGGYGYGYGYGGYGYGYGYGEYSDHEDGEKKKEKKLKPNIFEKFFQKK